MPNPTEQLQQLVDTLLHLQLLVARQFGAIVALCVLVVLGVTAWSCPVSVFTSLCVSSNRSVCKFKTRRMCVQNAPVSKGHEGVLKAHTERFEIVHGAV